ncbi:MAG: threonine--tRNA ligase [Dehalococcoidia bacterium]
MPLQMSDPSGIERALESKKGPADADDPSALRERIRHSASHIMADAVRAMFPEVKFAIGPPTEDGFYYDFQLPRALTEEDLLVIEEKMNETIASDLSFERSQVDSKTALRIFKDQPFKLEIIDAIADENLGIYTHGDFSDLCNGPHVDSTGQVEAFKLLSVAGAYWRGDENRPMLQRIYGTAFESKKALDEYLTRLEEAAKRDHRKLGKELGLYSIHNELGAGLICWQPRGGRIRSIVEDFWREEHLKRNYSLVYSPHIGKGKLWETSGHLEFYKESMYSAIDIDDQEYYLKPMNCPFHILMYKSSLRSYRELPMRLAELGTVYRYERTGVLHGLLRVRGFTQDDAHIFCRPDQLEEEVQGVLELTFSLLGAFGFKDYKIYLADRPEKHVGELSEWTRATDALRNTLEEMKLKYQLDAGGGAFYGPKIDVKIEDAIGRDWQCTTIQFDFNLPRRFDLSYIGDDGQQHRPFMVHRAILGSMERFMGILIEHYGGAFPVWLAPVQAVIIPITDRNLDYARATGGELGSAGLRVEVDDRSERMNQKIRRAQLEKVPYMLIVGDKEVAEGSVSVRLRSGEDLGPRPVASVIEMIREKVETKA